jgi:hypothetical protein
MFVRRALPIPTSLVTITTTTTRHSQSVHLVAVPLGVGAARASSVLGTSTLSPEFIEQLKDDLIEQEQLAEEERKVGGIFASCIRKGELDHMESPEADRRHLGKLEKQVDTLFARLPEPKDPLKAARAPTRAELEDTEKFEALKEAMRERYHGQNRRRKAEAARIDAAMKAVEDGTYDAAYAQSRPAAVRSEADGLKMSEADLENLKILQELQETKAKMRELEKQLEAAKKAGKL